MTLLRGFCGFEPGIVRDAIHTMAPARLNFSPWTNEVWHLLCERVRQVTGKSPLEMILRLRLEAVQAKLRDTSLSIGRIAADCGFGSRRQAMTLFKRNFGCAMREWRNKQDGTSP